MFDPPLHTDFSGFIDDERAEAIMALMDEELARRERVRPRSYDLSDPAERERLLRETIGYAKVSLHYGTDDEGRRYAYEALERAFRIGFRLLPTE